MQGIVVKQIELCLFWRLLRITPKEWNARNAYPIKIDCTIMTENDS